MVASKFSPKATSNSVTPGEPSWITPASESGVKALVVGFAVPHVRDDWSRVVGDRVHFDAPELIDVGAGRSASVVGSRPNDDEIAVGVAGDRRRGLLPAIVTLARYSVPTFSPVGLKR